MRKNGIFGTCCALVVTGMALTALCGGGASRAAEGGAAQETVNFRLGAHHPGVTTDPGPESLGRVLWEVRTGGPVRSSPAVADGVVYFGGTDGNVYAVDADSGALRWRAEIGVPVISGVALDGERVYVIDREHTVHALGRADGGSRWRRETGPDLPLPWGWEGWDYFTGSPTVVAGLLLAPSGDGHLYALDPASGEVRWSYDTGHRPRSSPAVAADRVFLGDGGGVVHALALDSGTVHWRFATRGRDLEAASAGFDRTQIYASPAVVDGVVYVGGRDALDYALDAATGEKLWESGDGGSAWVISSAAIADGRVYNARSSSAIVRALDAHDGTELWRYRGLDFVYPSPTRAARLLYAVDGSGLAVALEPDSGEVVWRYRPGGPTQATPVIDGDRMVLASDDGSVYAIAGRDGPSARLAVYHDPELRGRALFGGIERHDVAVEHFVARGYERLDGAGLSAFLRARLDDRAPSVVVAAMDALPAEVIEGGADSLLRAYLEAGGKLVWPGFPPGVFLRDEEGAINGMDRQVPSELLGVNFSGYNTDRYGGVPTAAGRAMGLESRWLGRPWTTSDADVGTLLAVNDLGQPMAFARSYGGPEGTGFVALYPPLDTALLDEIRRVAEYGILRSPSAPRVDIHPGAAR